MRSDPPCPWRPAPPRSPPQPPWRPRQPPPSPPPAPRRRRFPTRPWGWGWSARAAGHVVLARFVHLRAEQQRRAVRVEVHRAQRPARAQRDARRGGLAARDVAGERRSPPAARERRDERRQRGRVVFRAPEFARCRDGVFVRRDGGGGFPRRGGPRLRVATGAALVPLRHVSVAPGVELVPRRHGEDGSVRVERQAGDGLAEVEAQDALRGGGVPHAHLVVQRPADQHVGVRGMEPHDPGRAAMAGQHAHAPPGPAVDELHRVVAVRRREECTVRRVRRGDGRARGRPELAVRRGAVPKRVGLGPGAKRLIVRAGDGRGGRLPAPRGARAEPTPGIELARAEALVHLADADSARRRRTRVEKSGAGRGGQTTGPTGGSKRLAGANDWQDEES